MFGHGSSCLWGYSTSIDLNIHAGYFGERNFLILGAADARHVISTVGKLYKVDRNIKLNFYILETCAPAICRNLILLNTLWNSPELGLEEKTATILEIYGNALVREKTCDFIKTQASEIISLVNGNGALANVFDFSLLKYKERDDLEAVCRYWKDDTKVFDVEELWIRRMQQYFGRRYDSRENIIDWDYQIKVLDTDKKSLSILSRSEYLNWRLTGNAFEIRDADLNKPNKTLATVDVLKQDGIGVVKWGYFSDIIMGPFITFGIDTEEKELLKTQNDKHIKSCQDIVAHNISSIIYEFEHQDKMQENKIAEIKDVENLLERVKVHFLPCDPSYIFTRKKETYEKFFDCVFIANSLAHRICDAAPFLKEKGCMLVETAKYMPGLSQEQREMFVGKELSMAAEANLVCLSSANDSKSMDVIKLVNS